MTVNAALFFKTAEQIVSRNIDGCVRRDLAGPADFISDLDKIDGVDNALTQAEMHRHAVFGDLNLLFFLAH